MPLNDDPEALPDNEYDRLLGEAETRAIAAGEPPCRVAVPPDVLNAALARLDATNE